ncbi:MAG: type II toxin-antitoxin system PemK/MazF family toxin [Alphaproteobacteria bacterium]|nr:type II toxin-antitoxin system PemK/MazF family toxin [Alphaproteobacteria bacterium]
MIDSDEDFAAGDIVLVDFSPVRGHEQDGMRSALVMTDHSYNSASSYLIVCPITSNTRPWPFKMALPKGLKVQGYVMLDQIRSIDRRRRVLRLIDRVPRDVLLVCRERLGVLVSLRSVPNA